MRYRPLFLASHILSSIFDQTRSSLGICLVIECGVAHVKHLAYPPVTHTEVLFDVSGQEDFVGHPL